MVAYEATGWFGVLEMAKSFFLINEHSRLFVQIPIIVQDDLVIWNLKS